jgi:WD40 repeat protein
MRPQRHQSSISIVGLKPRFLDNYSSAGLAISPDNCLLAVAFGDQRICVYDTKTGAFKWESKETSEQFVTPSAFTLDGRALVFKERVYSAKDGKAVGTAKAREKILGSLALNKGGTVLAIPSNEGKVHLWDVSSSQPTLKAVIDVGKHVVGVGFSYDRPDAVQILCADASGYEWNQTTNRFDSTSGLHSDVFGDQPSTIYSNDQIIVDASESLFAIQDRWRPILSRNLKGIDSARIRTVASLFDGKRIVTGDTDKHVKIWDLSTGQELIQFSGYLGSVIAICVSPDGTRLAAADDQGITQIWNSSPIASADKNAALDPKSSDTISWHRSEADAATEAEANFRADFHLSQIVRQGKQTADDLASRAEIRARIEKYREAASDFDSALKLKPDAISRWNDLGLAYLATGNLTAFRKVCSSMSQRFSSSSKLAERDAVPYLACLVPDAGIDPKTLVDLADSTVKKSPKSAAWNETLGAALYRAGRFAAAKKALDHSRELKGDKANKPDSLFRAMFSMMTEVRLGPVEPRLLESIAKRRQLLMADEIKDAEWEKRVQRQVLTNELDSLLRRTVHPETNTPQSPVKTP